MTCYNHYRASDRLWKVRQDCAVAPVAATQARFLFDNLETTRTGSGASADAAAAPSKPGSRLAGCHARRAPERVQAGRCREVMRGGRHAHARRCLGPCATKPGVGLA